MLNVPFKSVALTDADLPTGDGPVEETQRFSWNVEAFITKEMDFTYYVGEGPLYWYRIDWYPSVCSAQTAADIAPTISFIEPNCPYEIIESCIILPPDCPCDLSCTPGDTCVTRDIEVWHMMATSVEQLCERINQECCWRKPPGFMRRVQQYMRPALCCDVPYPAGDDIDTYEDVDFIKCECGNLVDPCVNRFIYPAHINRCGIHGPVYVGPDPIPASTIALTGDIFGKPIVMEQAISVPVEVPKNLFGIRSIPNVIRCTHNLKDLIGNEFNNIDLYYNNAYKAWQGSRHFGNWKVLMEWVPSQDLSNNGFKFSLHIEKKDHKLLKSKIILNVRSNDTEFNFNTKSGLATSKNGITIQSKTFSDEIGIFKKEFDLKIKVKY